MRVVWRDCFLTCKMHQQASPVKIHKITGTEHRAWFLTSKDLINNYFSHTARNQWVPYLVETTAHHTSTTYHCHFSQRRQYNISKRAKGQTAAFQSWISLNQVCPGGCHFSMFPPARNEVTHTVEDTTAFSEQKAERLYQRSNTSFISLNINVSKRPISKTTTWKVN